MCTVLSCFYSKRCNENKCVLFCPVFTVRKRKKTEGPGECSPAESGECSPAESLNDIIMMSYQLNQFIWGL